ncbi:MAG: hypothetical protein OEZ06_27630 [Myxococcales bacterium]|nr:hypothetical protein [Myxococcales bacterium]
MDVPAETSPFEPRVRLLEREPEFDVDRFANRRLGILGEQGQLEEARQILARRAVAERADAEVYLDAIRLEIGAPSSEQVWMAWLSRGLAHGAPLLPELFEVVSRSDLMRFVAGDEFGWRTLSRQQDLDGARDLLRLRLLGQLQVDTDKALEALEEAELGRAAGSDPELRALALATLRVALFDRPERVMELARGFGVEPTSAGAGPGVQALVSDLMAAHRTRPMWSRVGEQVQCPRPLERIVRFGSVASLELGEALRRELVEDLLSQPQVYLRVFQIAAYTSASLVVWLEALLLEVATTGDLVGGPEDAEVEQAAALARVERSAATDPLTHLVRAGAVGAIAATLVGYVALGPWALATLPAAALGVAALRRVVDLLLYRRLARPGWSRVMAEGSLDVEGLRAVIERERPGTISRRLLRRAGEDRALKLLGAVARLGSRAERGWRL